MLCFSVNSGSNGNCIYVEAGGVKLLLDAGISGKQADLRLAHHARDVRAVDAVIITHDHSDHVRCAGIMARKFDLPVYMTHRTHVAAGQYTRLGPIEPLNYFPAGGVLKFGDVTVETYPTPHDAAEPLVFVIAAEGKRLGVLTDLGHVFAGLETLLSGLDAVFLESNYDPEMLRTGPYPPHLKRRIVSEHGHISNVEAAELVARHAGGRLQWVSLAHLSEVNNTPELAHQTHRNIVGGRRPIHLAGRYDVGPMLQVE